MVQTTNRFFDEMARLMNDAAGVAQGARREFDTMMRAQADRFLRTMDLVKREEFDVVKDMARLAREENEDLKARVAALEAKLAAAPFVTPPIVTPPPSRVAPTHGATPTTMSSASQAGDMPGDPPPVEPTGNPPSA